MGMHFCVCIVIYYLAWFFVVNHLIRYIPNNNVNILYSLKTIYLTLTLLRNMYIIDTQLLSIKFYFGIEAWI